MGKWILIGLAVIVLITVFAVMVGRARETTRLTRLVDKLIDRSSAPDVNVVDFDSLSGLPPPVIRYFKHVLAKNQKLIKIVRMHQSGVLRTNMKIDAWSSFTADQIVVPFANGFVWNAIDERSAMATLTDIGITVSLEFRFNDANEVTAIYSSGRFARFDGGYKQLPWEGHFLNYQDRGGISIPIYGEVGWYEDETLYLVWKGNLKDSQYQLGE